MASPCPHDNTTFARITSAYEVLGNSQRRKRYDISGKLAESDLLHGKGAGQTLLAEDHAYDFDAIAWGTIA